MASCPTSSTRSSPGVPVRAFVQVTGAATVVVGHDMRPTSPGLAEAFAAGASRAGADVVMIGLASTDQLYFASGALGHPGAMFTASHNPAQYNGIKLCRAGAQPVGATTGLHEIRDAVSRPEPEASGEPGVISRRDVLDDYAAHLLALVPVTGRRLKVVVDAGNGMAGLTAPVVLGRAGRPGADVLRARRHVPPPRGQPDRAGEPPRPPGTRRRRGRRHRAGVRR